MSYSEQNGQVILTMSRGKAHFWMLRLGGMHGDLDGGKHKGWHNCDCALATLIKDFSDALNSGKPELHSVPGGGQTMRWRRIGVRTYQSATTDAMAIVFGAHPTSAWALSIYWKGGHFGRVEPTFKLAKRRVEEFLANIRREGKKL